MTSAPVIAAAGAAVAAGDRPGSVVELARGCAAVGVTTLVRAADAAIAASTSSGVCASSSYRIAADAGAGLTGWGTVGTADDAVRTRSCMGA
ncbi:MAG: hypothetical protein AB7L28_10485, partial [Kofleriaceae bacterium]